MSKRVQITADIFNDKKLTALMDFAAFINPAKSKNEQQSRALMKERIRNNDLGEPVERRSGFFDREGILIGATLFDETPRITRNDIKLINDAGFDFLLSLTNGEYGRNILDWCKEYNLPVIGNEIRWFINGDFDAFCNMEPERIKAFSFHPVSVGDGGIDEPLSEDFPYLKKVHDVYNRYFPNRVLFSNLLAAFESKKVLGENSYRKYIDKFAKTVETDYICADIYPFHPSKLLNVFEMYVCLNTYHTLSDICRRDGRDFWLYIQSQGKWFSHLYAMTTSEMIKWQVYTALCYGCRCIMHVSYNPVWGNDAVGMIDYDGNLTEQYLYVKEINKDIKPMTDVLRDYRALGVSFVKASKSNPNFGLAKLKQKKNNRQQGFSGIPCIKSISGESTALAGYFQNKKSSYGLMLVNCRNFYDPDASQTVTVSLNTPMRIRIINHGTVGEETVTDSFSVNIKSCEGAFIQFEEKV